MKNLIKSAVRCALFVGFFQAASLALANGPALVNLGSAGHFAILSKAGITNVPTSAVVGDVGTSPISGSANGLTCVEVTGSIYSVDAAGPAPCNIWDATLLTAAVGDMQTAYTDAAGRTGANIINFGASDISGLTLAPGLYTWSSGLLANTDFTFNGSADDVWILQVSGDFTVGPGVIMHLSGGAQASHIFWQVGGGVGVSLGTTSHMEGVILAAKSIAMNTGASINGSLFSQTAVTLQSNVVKSVGPKGAEGETYIYPSPAKGSSAAIVYRMASPGTVKIKVYNETGDLVDSLQDSKQAGSQESKVDLRSFAPGVYIYLVSMAYDSGKSEKLAAKKFVVMR